MHSKTLTSLMMLGMKHRKRLAAQSPKGTSYDSEQGITGKNGVSTWGNVMPETKLVLSKQLSDDDAAAVHQFATELMDENERLRGFIRGAPDPAMFKPEELEEAFLKWQRNALSVSEAPDE